MKKNKVNKPSRTDLTERMDFGTNDYFKFVEIIKRKSTERTSEEIKKLEELSKKYKKEDSKKKT